MPRASVRTAMALKPGFFASIRAPKRMSCHRLVTRRPPYRLDYSDEVSGPDVLNLIREFHEKVRFAAILDKLSAEPRPGPAKLRYFNRIRSTLSHCDISERTTLSPTFKPSTISTVLTELRPSFTVVRIPSESSGVTLKRLIVLSDWPCT